MTNHPLIVSVLVFALGVVADCSASADTWTADEVAIARLTVSEASFRESSDARVITWIVAHASKRRGLSPAAYIASTYHRHPHSTSRPWLAGLDGSLAEPSGWPADADWSRASRAWERRLSDVRRYLSADAHGCDGVPLTWGGPRVDSRRIAAWQAKGYRVLSCGGTANRFIGARR